ncbi:response regulator [Pedosphaera parvula]|uniref:Response regulator receiver protein n=1 Tax=Pedosphaera parvula (strain Ellin514) TaxID=320771 RepID=B9XQ93_PEDPL|nr:response regulator [Pedosphaera parvula]EEF58011.1 response regulator receiver protein [Pedosphaera parvula Ellin514]
MENNYILLVEDNRNDEILARRALQKNSINNPLFVAHDGVEAIEFLMGTGSYSHRDARQLPALVLLDLKLPRMDGLEVLRQLRSHELTRRLPVVVLTSSDEEQDVKRSYELGVNNYIRKPVDFNEFVETVRQLSLYWLQFSDKVMINNKER